MTTSHPALAKPIAHRGMHDAANGIIENSASAFTRAIDRGFAVECDLQLSADGEPVVIHDGTLDRVCEVSGSVAEMTAAEVTATPLAGSSAGDTPLHFRDLLALTSGRVAIAVELKPQAGGRNRALAKAAVANLRHYEGLVAFISFAPEMLSHVRAEGFTGPTGIIVERFVSEVAQKYLKPHQRFAMRHLLHYPQTRFDLIACDQHALDLPAVRLFHRLGFPVLTWTITSPAQAEAALKRADQIAFENYDPES